MCRCVRIIAKSDARHFSVVQQLTFIDNNFSIWYILVFVCAKLSIIPQGLATFIEFATVNCPE